jgi:translation initiation factor IF-3
VIAEDGSQIGILETYQALQMAQEQGLDLVEISADVRPPVCKLMDFGRHKYEKSRADRERKKKATDNTPKEVRFRPTTDTHDMDVKINRAAKFLETGHKVKLTVRFRGREMRRQDVGRETLRTATERLKTSGKLDSSIPDMQGRMISVTMSPLSKK